MIPEEILNKYHIFTSSWKDSEESLYRTFLLQTADVVAEIVEAQYLGKTLDEDYTEILAYRQIARDAINQLEGETP